MPNWVKHKITFDGPSDRIEEMLNSIKKEKDGKIIPIDFNKIIPISDSHDGDVRFIWGTKWNACDPSYEGGILEFDTAWSTPEPVLVRLSELNPEITFTIDFADEDIGSNCGQYILKGGDGDFQEYDGIKACEIWGLDPAEVYSDIYRDKQIDKVLEDDNDNSSLL